ncbi:MAG: hypothetical protein E8D40_05600 [Nitrospira sp.]|nr:MAG: hypothetical protein E8D40_05600 [Nitrospira sp.]
MRKFVGDLSSSSIDVVGSHTDIVLRDLIALLDGIGQGRRCKTTNGESTKNNDDQSANKHIILLCSSLVVQLSCSFAILLTVV